MRRRDRVVFRREALAVFAWNAASCAVFFVNDEWLLVGLSGAAAAYGLAMSLVHPLGRHDA